MQDCFELRWPGVKDAPGNKGSGEGKKWGLQTFKSIHANFIFSSTCSGFKLLLEVFSVIHGPQEECVRALKNGHMLGISPGGVREALFSDETYPLLWGKRKGFAQVAIDSQVVCFCFSIHSCYQSFKLD